MEAVYAHATGDDIQVYRTLDKAEEDLLKVHCQDITNKEVQDLLRELYQCQVWITCNCGRNNSKKPMLYVAKAGNDYLLQPIKDRVPHFTNCSYHYQATAHPDRDVGGVLGGIIEELVAKSKARHLEWPGRDTSILLEQIQGLTDAAKHTYMEQKRVLGGLLGTRVSDIPRIARRALREKKSFARDPWGALLLVITRYSESNLQVSQESQPLTIGAGDIEVIETKDGSITGPYLALVKVERRQNSDFFDPTSAVLLPVFNRGNLIPVTDDSERRTLNVLMRVQQQMLYDYQIMMSIRKTPVDSAHAVRGIDFQLLLRNQNGTTQNVIDIMTVDGSGMKQAKKSFNPPLNGMLLYHIVERDEGLSDFMFEEALTNTLLGTSSNTDCMKKPVRAS